MNLLVGSVGIGFVLALLGLGVFVQWRIFRTVDLTADGAFLAGAAATAVMLTHGRDPITATVAGVVAGYCCGLVTGLLRALLGVDPLLAGVLTSSAIYSVALVGMQGGDVPLGTVPTLFTWVERALTAVVPTLDEATVFGTPVGIRNWATMLGSSLAALLALVGLSWFFSTRLGLAIRACGSSPAMARALGAPIQLTEVVGLVLANGLVGTAGALFAQFQGFANISMGFGIIVTALASIVLGEALLRPERVTARLAAVAAGAIAFRLAVALALRAGLDPNLLKLGTAVVVLTALVLPDLGRRLRLRVARG